MPEITIFFVFFGLILFILLCEYLEECHGTHIINKLCFHILFPMIGLLFAIKAFQDKDHAFDWAVLVFIALTVALIIESRRSAVINRFVRFSAYAISALLLLLYYINKLDEFPKWLSDWLNDKDGNFLNVAVIMFVALDKMFSEFDKMIDERKKKLNPTEPPKG